MQRNSLTYTHSHHHHHHHQIYTVGERRASQDRTILHGGRVCSHSLTHTWWEEDRTRRRCDAFVLGCHDSTDCSLYRRIGNAAAAAVATSAVMLNTRCRRNALNGNHDLVMSVQVEFRFGLKLNWIGWFYEVETIQWSHDTLDLLVDVDK